MIGSKKEIPVAWIERNAAGEEIVRRCDAKIIDRSEMIYELYELMRPVLIRRLKYSVANDGRLTELTEEEAGLVFDKAIEKILKDDSIVLDADQNPCGFIYRIAIRKQIDYLRSRAYKESQRTEVVDNLPDRLLNSPQHGNLELRNALGRLKPAERAAIELAEIGGYSRAEAAKELKVTIHEVGYLIRRGMAALRKFYGVTARKRGARNTGGKSHKQEVKRALRRGPRGRQKRSGSSR